MDRLTDKVAIVTGAGAGIGRASAHLLAAQGACVLINDLGRNPSGELSAEVVAREITEAGGVGIASTHDIRSFEECRSAVELAMAEYGRLDILINNAGMFARDTVGAISEEEWSDVLRVNLTGTYAMTRAAAPVLTLQPSSVIINMSSAAGLGHTGAAHYASSKEGVIGLTRSLARELGHRGLRCNAIRPQALDTNMATAAGAERFPLQPLREALGRYATGSMRHLLSDPTVAADVAAFAVWLCTDAARSVNGRTFHVAGSEIGLFSEPEVERVIVKAGGWDLDSLDRFAPRGLTVGLNNDFDVVVDWGDLGVPPV